MSDSFKLIKNAFDRISRLTKFSEEDFRNAVKPVAEYYNAVLVSMEIPFKAGSGHILTLYGDSAADINGCQVVRYEGEQSVGGKTVLTWIGSTEHKWSDEDIEDIRFFSKSACVMSEKLRLGEMANRYFYFDTLTGLNNFNGLSKIAAQLVRRGVFDDYGCAFINLVGFNYVNKKVGFRTGTKVMMQYAERLREMFDRDEVVSRVGGDNFIIFFKKKNIDKINRIAEGITINVRINSVTINFDLTARAGVFMVDRPDIPLDKVLTYLSNSINYAKSYSRTNVVFYTKDIEHKVVEYKEYCQKFRRAIDKKEFFVVYQPKVYTKNNTLYGAEALVRWHSDNRTIYPGEFVEIFEKAHLINELDFYVLDQACSDLRKWLDNGYKPVKVSVNFSNEHLDDDDLVERITEIVDRYDIDHKLIEIEMTETVDVYETNRLLSYVNGLHQNGFTVAIDDFGIGYSSLLMLQSISVDVLKIDKAFIAEVTGDQNKRENIILRHIINMADDLGVEIVAEGVETGDQRENLTSMNCHRIQGYFYDKPLSSSNFSDRLAVRTY